MLSKEDNEILTQVGPGTLMGELLRRYWTPACLASEIPEPDSAPVRVRLLGEQLVAFRDSDGQIGLMEELCPHRGASLFFGRNEECGLRCPYHGWKFDTTGQCVDQPSELRSFASQIKLVSYPTHESGGIVWTYMGPPENITPFRDFGTEDLDQEFQAASKEHLDCNWIQSLDGDVDTAHISHLHQFNGIDDLPDDDTDRPGYNSNFMSMKFWRHDPKAVLEVEDEWFGFRYAGLRRTPNGHRHVRMSCWIMPYSSMIGFVPIRTNQYLLVPISDTESYRYALNTHPPMNVGDLGGPPYFAAPNYPFLSNPSKGIIERRYTLANDYQIDREAQKHTTFTGIVDFRSHDNMATESSGPIFDRTREHLGSGDIAVSRLHTRLLEAARALANGVEPPALVGNFRTIRAGEKILEEGEDWRVIGTDADPIVQESLLAGQD
jgi:phthalate 4,5-dioxygenase